MSRDFDGKTFVRSLSGRPGVYRMLAENGEVLYVGKARNLKKRVSSYFLRRPDNPRIRAMLQHVAGMEISVTHSETEALLLESNLIKSLKPRYNIQLRDDKSYPYIFLSDQPFPRLAFHRGARREKGRYFGPYPSAASVRDALALIQKVFPVRQCDDTVFRHRSRPCLQYQIRRCTAPCVGLVSEAAYADDVRHAAMFLEGQSSVVIEDLIRRMDEEATALNYEMAAHLRDRITALRKVQERQAVSSEAGEADIVAIVKKGNDVCAGVTFVRQGRNLGTRNFFPKPGSDNSLEELLAGFLAQYYFDKQVPPVIVLNHHALDSAWLEAALTERSSHAVKLISRPRGLQRRWAKLAELNARAELARHLAGRSNLLNRFESLQESLQLETLPERLECFDVSHTQGEATVASCVVFTREGPQKSDYRRFNITDVQPGDDYAAIEQVLSRRYRRMLESDPDREHKLPDLIIIDGGKGQLSRAESVLHELGLHDVRLLAIAKGEERKPGKEQLFLSGREGATILPPDSHALHLLQQVRDEAHRFAITGHRQRRAKARRESILEGIPGIGTRRRQLLLKRLGGMQEVSRASVEQLESVPGISPSLAQRIHAVFHEEEV